MNEKDPISAEDFFKLSRSLKDKYSIFSKLWEIGKPVFTDRVPTAAVEFDKNGKCVNFIFNPDYWNSIDDYTRIFVISHEALHIILNHGVRTKDAENNDATNEATDIIVNHLLIDKFGFIKSNIKDSHDLCWTDTCFEKQVPSNMNFEYYYNLLKENNTKAKGQKLVDCHNFPSIKDIKDIIEDISSKMNDEDREKIKDILHHFEENKKDKKGKKGKKDKNEKSGSKAGTQAGNIWLKPKIRVKPKPKPKWETIIKTIIRKKLKESYANTEQWIFKNRRMHSISDDLILPSEVEMDKKDFDKIEVFFFLDSSGSCYDYANRFVKVAMTIPKDKFDVRFFCFDTQVYPVDMKAPKLIGYGGTSFTSIEQEIQKICKEEKKDYPSIIICLTDGEGDMVKPQHPNRWYFILVPTYDFRIFTGCIPRESKYYNIKNFE